MSVSVPYWVDVPGDRIEKIKKSIASVACRGSPIRVVDLFSGVGGFSHGLRKLTEDAGIDLQHELAVDTDRGALDVFIANHGGRAHEGTVQSLVDFSLQGIGHDARFIEYPVLLDDSLPLEVDIVVAGPPCQGNSYANFITFGNHELNNLYIYAAAFGIASDANAIVIENVYSVTKNEQQSVSTSLAMLRSAGYHCTEGIIQAKNVGWPQSRRRHFLVGRRDEQPIPIQQCSLLFESLEIPGVWSAISDLEHKALCTNVLNTITKPRDLNKKRIKYMYDNDLTDLPLEMAPPSHCQQGGIYMSAYSRMLKDKPCNALTTKFMRFGCGRYYHPTQPRSLTCHEGARIQGFPDSYKWIVDEDNPPFKRNVAKWIGNAVALPHGYISSLSALGQLEGQQLEML